MKKILFAIFTILVCVLFAGCEHKAAQPEYKADFDYYDNYSYVEFTNTSTSGFHAWSWEFGDGGSYTNEETDGLYIDEVRHTYNKAGVYNVRMKVYDRFRGKHLTCTKEVRVRM